MSAAPLHARHASGAHRSPRRHLARGARQSLAALGAVSLTVVLVAGVTRPPDLASAASHRTRGGKAGATATATATVTATATATETVTATSTVTATAAETLTALESPPPLTPPATTPAESGTPTPTPTPTPVPVPTSPTTPTASTDPTYLAGWGLPVWHDEFDGDLSQWNVRNNDTANGMLERRMAANVATTGGGLVITAKKENIPGTTQQYTSGYVDTIGRDDHVGPGTEVVERAKFPTDPNVGKGMWSALWFRNDNGPGEVDLVEAYSNKPDLANAWECVVISVHEKTDGSGSHKTFVYRFPAGQFPYQVAHDYGVEFQRDHLVFTIDGKVVWAPSTATYPWMATELADTWNMRVNQQISAASQWFYAPDAGTVFSRQMDVDFVRVYAQ